MQRSVPSIASTARTAPFLDGHALARRRARPSPWPASSRTRCRLFARGLGSRRVRMPCVTSSSGQRSRAERERHPVAGELGDHRQQQGVVAFVRRERIPHLDRPPVGQQRRRARPASRCAGDVANGAEVLGESPAPDGSEWDCPKLLSIRGRKRPKMLGVCSTRGGTAPTAAVGTGCHRRGRPGTHAFPLVGTMWAARPRSSGDRATVS